MLPCFMRRKRTGVNRLTRNVSRDPAPAVHQANSLVLDVLYTSGISMGATYGVTSWRDLAVPTRSWDYLPSSKPLFAPGAGLHASTAGALYINSGSVAFTGAFTFYWLASYAGTRGDPIGKGDGNQSQLRILGTTAYVYKSDGTSVSADGGVSGFGLYRWRRTSGNACYFRGPGGVEVSLGTLAGTLTFGTLFFGDGPGPGEYDHDSNRTMRMAAYDHDLVADGTDVAYETKIVDSTPGGSGPPDLGTNPTSLAQTVLNLPWKIANLLHTVTPPVTPLTGETLIRWVGEVGGNFDYYTSGTAAPLLNRTSGAYVASGNRALTGSRITLSDDFTIWIWCVVGSGTLYPLGDTATESSIYISSSLIRIHSGLNTYASYAGGPSAGLRLIRIRRVSGTCYVAFDSSTEHAMTDNSLGSPVFGVVLSYALNLGIVSSDSTEFLRWVVICDETSTPLTANEVEGVEQYIVSFNLAARTPSSTDPSTLTQCVLDLPWVAGNILNNTDTPAGDGVRVKTWTDASTAVNNFTQATAGSRPFRDATNGVHSADGASGSLGGSAVTLTGDFTIWVWSYNTVLDVFIPLGGSGGTDRYIMLADDGTIGLLNGAGKSAAYTDTPRPTGLALYRIRRSGTSFYVAFTGQAEVAMTVTGTPGTIVFDTVLAYRAAIAIDTYSIDSQYLKWLVIMDESGGALTAGQRSSVETYISGSALT